MSGIQQVLIHVGISTVVNTISQPLFTLPSTHLPAALSVDGKKTQLIPFKTCCCQGGGTLLSVLLSVTLLLVAGD
jgi:hypothetical protein